MQTSPAITRRSFLAAGAALVLPARAESFDHSHGAWTVLLKKHVVPLQGGKASKVRYAGMAIDRPALKAYLAALSSVSSLAFEAFGKAQQMAFLINAYNAFTIELILTRYPKLASIKEIGRAHV